jgi:3-methyladenine DNA glycosylase AlkC
MEPFKNLFNVDLVQGMATHFARHHKGFNKKDFVQHATRDFSKLELKQRSNAIVEAMAKHLPQDFGVTAAILQSSLHTSPPDDLYGAVVSDEGILGWGIMPMGEYVGLYGQQHIDLSLDLLKEMTSRFTSESAIRHFFLADAKRTLKVVKPWTRDANRHVRRLVSEGSRPLLPWSPKLQVFVEDPSLIMPLLEALRNDPEEYVRRSVANNLNDIAKHHPDLVAETAERWLRDADKDEQRMVRHACRTLLKQGHARTLAAFGYGEAEIEVTRFDIQAPEVTLGEHLVFDLELKSLSDKIQPLLVDFVVHHRKANGSTSPKVFKWKSITLKPGSNHAAQKKHAIKPITTRVYYPGEHFLELQINGRNLGKIPFWLNCSDAE